MFNFFRNKKKSSDKEIDKSNEIKPIDFNKLEQKNDKDNASPVLQKNHSANLNQNFINVNGTHNNKNQLKNRIQNIITGNDSINDKEYSIIDEKSELFDEYLNIYRIYRLNNNLRPIIYLIMKYYHNNNSLFLEEIVKVTDKKDEYIGSDSIVYKYESSIVDVYREDIIEFISLLTENNINIQVDEYISLLYLEYILYINYPKIEKISKYFVGDSREDFFILAGLINVLDNVDESFENNVIKIEGNLQVDDNLILILTILHNLINLGLSLYYRKKSFGIDWKYNTYLFYYEVFNKTQYFYNEEYAEIKKEQYPYYRLLNKFLFTPEYTIIFNNFVNKYSGEVELFLKNNRLFRVIYSNEKINDNLFEDFNFNELILFREIIREKHSELKDFEILEFIKYSHSINSHLRIFDEIDTTLDWTKESLLEETIRTFDRVKQSFDSNNEDDQNSLDLVKSILMRRLSLNLVQLNLEFDYFSLSDLYEVINNYREKMEYNQFVKDIIEGPTRDDNILQIPDVSSLDGYEFEKFLANLFSKMGYFVEETKLSQDQGADLILIKNGNRYAVQAKRYTGSVGNTAIQEVFAAKTHYQCDYALVVTTGTYTKSAVDLAESCSVMLWNGKDLENMIEKYYK